MSARVSPPSSDWPSFHISEFMTAIESNASGSYGGLGLRLPAWPEAGREGIGDTHRIEREQCADGCMEGGKEEGRIRIAMATV